MSEQTKDNESEKEEWGGWKIVSDMLDNPDICGIYPTSKCYKKLYDFVCVQKTKARENILEEIENNQNWKLIPIKLREQVKARILSNIINII